MDNRLHERLSKWHAAIDELAKAEKLYLELEANEDSMWSAIFLEAQGTSISEREARTNVNARWLDFQSGLVEAKVEFNRMRRELDLKQSAFQAEYLQCKQEAEAIAKTPRGVL